MYIPQCCIFVTAYPVSVQDLWMNADTATHFIRTSLWWQAVHSCGSLVSPCHRPNHKECLIRKRHYYDMTHSVEAHAHDIYLHRTVFLLQRILYLFRISNINTRAVISHNITSFYICARHSANALHFYCRRPCICSGLRIIGAR